MPVSGVMAFGRLDGNEVAVVAVSLPVTVLVDGATMMVVGSQDSEESVIVEMAVKLLPRVVSEDTVVMLGSAAEVVVVSSEVISVVVVPLSVAGIVTLGGSVTVVGSSAVVVGTSCVVEFWDTVASVVVGGRIEVLTVGRSPMVVLAVIGISAVVDCPPVLMIVVPLLTSVGVGKGEVTVEMPVPGPVAEGSIVCTDEASVAVVSVVAPVAPVPGPVADASIVDSVEDVMPVPGPVTEASIVVSAVVVGVVTPVPGPVAEGSTV